MERMNIYIDESGNTDLEIEKSGASNYFIVCAILIGDESVNQVKEGTEELRKKYFQTGEIKSQGIRDRNDYERRVRILNEVQSLPFKFYALAVDKSLIYRDSGLQFKKSFVKNINGKLYSRLLESYVSISLTADEHGSEEFKASFIRYMQDNHKPDLFHETGISLVNSKSDVLVQLADFVVGTIAKIYEKKVRVGRLYEAYLPFLKDKCLGLDEWPTRYQSTYDEAPGDSTADQFIESHCTNQAEIFIEKNEGSTDSEIRVRVITLRYLVFNLRWGERESYVSTAAILEHLKENGLSKISSHAFRSSVIAKLRDANVIIASGTKGYKIPSTLADITNFVRTIDTNVVPLLNRLAIARKSLLLASKGDVDILGGPTHPHIVELLDVLSRYQK